MMGSQMNGQDRLFYSFNLEDHIPPDHLLRGIDRFLELDSLREHLAPFYSHTGRPSVDPELMIRMLVVGYCFGIRSERRLCEEVHLNLAYRWFCRLGLEDEVPDHSTFSKNRHGRFRDSDALRYVFESVLHRCVSEGLVQGEGFAVDASVIRADASRARGIDQSQRLERNSSDTTRAVREYLDALDESSPEEQPATEPKRISPTDPSARWTAAPGGPAFYAYSTNYLIDLHAGIIVDVEATPAYRSQEVNSTKTMIDRVEERFQLKPERLVGDTAYGTASLLGWMVEQKDIEPHVPVWDKTQRKDETFSSNDFEWNETANEYRCPQGHPLRGPTHSRSPITKENTIIFRSNAAVCSTCALKNRCCPNTSERRIKRSIYENARDVARRLATTRAYRRSRRERKRVEMLFAHLKRVLKLDRLRLRGLSGAHDEFLMAATAQNLRRMAKC
ncbi:MAG TPA: IS1182 family transposase [Steroidobacteraceae bacterium]|jgi:transposase|nr:IS1182 family transposase [Steroidobacteraceae bacterium]